MALPATISSQSDAEEYVAFSVSGLIARLRGSNDLRVSEAALNLEKRIGRDLKPTAPPTRNGGKAGKASGTRIPKGGRR